MSEEKESQKIVKQPQLSKIFGEVCHVIGGKAKW